MEAGNKKEKITKKTSKTHLFSMCIICRISYILLRYEHRESALEPEPELNIHFIHSFYIGSSIAPCFVLSFRFKFYYFCLRWTAIFSSIYSIKLFICSMRVFGSNAQCTAIHHHTDYFKICFLNTQIIASYRLACNPGSHFTIRQSQQFSQCFNSTCAHDFLFGPSNFFNLFEYCMQTVRISLRARM